MTPEGEVKKRVKEIFKDFGVDYIMPAAGGYGGIGGISDFIAWPAGLFLAVETKATKDDKPTPLQLRFMERVLRGGGAWLLIYNDNFDVLTNTLRRMMRGEKL